LVIFDICFLVIPDMVKPIYLAIVTGAAGFLCLGFKHSDNHWKDEMTISEKVKFVARVIFSEAGPECSQADRLLVRTTMRNRAMHEGFKADNVYEAASQPGAYSCVNDPKNRHWAESEGYPLSDIHHVISDLDTAIAWSQAVDLAMEVRGYMDGSMQKAGGTQYPIMTVYYHDHSIDKPASWDNKWFTAIKRGDTGKLIYYSAILNTMDKEEQSLCVTSSR